MTLLIILPALYTSTYLPTANDVHNYCGTNYLMTAEIPLVIGLKVLALQTTAIVLWKFKIFLLKRTQYFILLHEMWMIGNRFLEET